MTRFNGHHEPDEQHDKFMSELSRPVDAPDLTRSIMGRLGYMQVDASIARRFRARRRIGRACMLGLIMVTIISGIFVMNHSDAVRRPHEVTIPSAIGLDLQQNQHRVNTLIRVLQSSAPPHAELHLSPAVAVSNGEDGPTLDHKDHKHESGAPRAPGADQTDRHEIFEDPWLEMIDDSVEQVEQPAIAPVRWVSSAVLQHMV